MKKVFLSAIILSLFSLSAISSHAEGSEPGIKISYVMQDEASEEIKLDAKVTNPLENQYATIMIYKKDTDYTKAENVYLLDQIKPSLNQNGEFALSLNLKENAGKGWYVARMGGTKIKTADTYEFYYIDNESGDLTGDVDGSGRINTGDVISLLQYTVGKNNPNFKSELADINGDTVVDNLDITYLLRALAGYQQEKDVIFS